MIQAKVNNREINISSDDRLTTGSSGIQVKFSFSGEWGKVTSKTVIFTAGEFKRVVSLNGSRCTVPSAMLDIPGENLSIGVVGIDENSDLIIATVMSNPIKIYEGATAKL